MKSERGLNAEPTDGAGCPEWSRTPIVREVQHQTEVGPRGSETESLSSETHHLTCDG